MDTVVILIPCYNEEKTIAKVVRDYQAVLPGAPVYVYDNNSTDNTCALAQEAGAIVRHEYHQGKGNVIRRMFREVDAACYILVDGDDTYPAESAPEMARLVLERHADMVVGDRLSSTYYTENKRRFHGFGNTLVRKTINQIFDSDIRDVMTGYRAFSYLFAKSFPVLSTGFEIETEMTIHAVDKRLQVENVVVRYRDRPEGSESKLNTIPDGIRVLKMISRLCRVYKPMLFFGGMALILAALSILFFLPVGAAYARTGLVERFPTLIVCGFVMLCAVQLWFAGMILQNLRQKELSDFEMRLHEVEEEKKR